MSWWNAKYKNAHDEYEITFGSKYKEKTKIVEKVCKWIIDKLVQSEDDIAIVRHGRWVARSNTKGQVYCSECGTIEKITDSNFKSTRCPNCGAKMDGDTHGNDEM